MSYTDEAPERLYNLSLPDAGQSRLSDRLRLLADQIDQTWPDHIFNAYQSGGVVAELEARVAELVGTPAATWFPSGVMAQGAALKVWSEDRQENRVGLHASSHLLLHEEDSYRELWGLDAECLGQRGQCLSPDDIPDDASDLSALVIELPQRHEGGVLPDWDSLNEIIHKARNKGAAIHMDGARLWSCRPFYQRPYNEIASLFDSVYVSLYKDVGAPFGAVLAGSEAFIDKARTWRTRAGGTLYAAGGAVEASVTGLEELLPRIDRRVEVARAVAEDLKTEHGLSILPSPPHTNMFHIQFDQGREQVLAALQTVADETGVRLAKGVWPDPDDRGCALEITINDRFEVVPAQQLKRAFTALKRALSEIS